jgi:hypothetical protein
MILFLLAPKVLVADDNINGVTLCSLRNYVDLFVQLEGVKNSIKRFCRNRRGTQDKYLKNSFHFK